LLGFFISSDVYASIGISSSIGIVRKRRDNEAHPSMTAQDIVTL
jgi:hypothetical protein